VKSHIKRFRLPVVEGKMRAKYVNISIHEDLAKEIDEYIKKAKRGYRSRAEVVSDAVRRLLDKKN